MVRIALLVSGQVGKGRSVPGRGAWLCKEETCRQRAVRSGAIPRALKAPVRVKEEALLELLEALSR